jgi:hypothetical protein
LEVARRKRRNKEKTELKIEDVRNYPLAFGHSSQSQIVPFFHEHAAEVALVAASYFCDIFELICVVSANTATLVSIRRQILVNFHGAYHPIALHTPCVVPSTYL